MDVSLSPHFIELRSVTSLKSIRVCHEYRSLVGFFLFREAFLRSTRIAAPLAFLPTNACVLSLQLLISSSQHTFSGRNVKSQTDFEWETIGLSSVISFFDINPSLCLLGGFLLHKGIVPANVTS